MHTPATDHWPLIYRHLLCLLTLAGAVVIAYLPALNGTPVWDDDGHMTKATLRSVGGFAKIWVEPGATQQYYPVVHSVFWLQDRLWGASPLEHHLVNLILHVGSTILLWHILLLLEIPGALLAAALFALHPVQVESVAWITELKNTLSGFFYLAAALVYLRFDRTRHLPYYGLALILFILALLSKSVTASLPAALLLVFWWERGQLHWRRDIFPLLPFFVLGIAAGLFTAWVERHFIGARGAEFELSFVQRMLIAGRTFWFYLHTLIWPHPLIFICPRWEVDPSVWWQYLFPVAALALFVTAWYFRRQRGPLTALLFFAGTLFPALGFINVYPFRYSFVADHFQYLAAIGPLTLIGAAVAITAHRLNRPHFTGYFAALVLSLLGFLTWQHAHQFQDMESLWRTTLAKDPDCWLACNNLSSVLLQKGMDDEVIVLCQKSLSVRADNNAEAHVNLGLFLCHRGHVDEAISHFQKALEAQPGSAETLMDLGAALLKKGQLDAAIETTLKAVRLRPDSAEAHYSLGGNLYE